MRSHLLAACCLLILSSLSAQQTVPFNDSIPSNWHASAGSTLSLNTEHLKEGSHALKWSASAGDTLTASALGIPGSALSSSSHFYLFNPGAGQDSLTIQFLDASNTVKREAHLLLNFHGWREYHRNLLDDFNYGASLPTFNLNAFRIIYHPATPGGSVNLWLDEIKFAGYGQARTPGPHMALDYQHFALNPEDGPAGNSLFSWLNVPDIPDTTASPADLSALSSIRTAFALPSPIPDTALLTKAKNFVTACNITRNADNSITGRPDTSITVYHLDTLSILSTYAGALATAWLSNSDTDAKNKLLLFTEYLLDQGLAEGGRTVIMTNEYNSIDSFAIGWLRALPVYSTAMKHEVLAMLRFSHEFNKLYASSFTPGLNLDYLYKKTPWLYRMACADTSDNQAARDLKTLARFLERNTVAGIGGRDGFKADGTGFHHQAHYVAYLHADSSWIDCAYKVRGTPFQISTTAYNNFSNEIKALYLETSKGTIFDNADCGRVPFSTSIPPDSSDFSKLLVVGGSLAGVDRDPALTAVFNYFYGVNSYGVTAADLNGYYALNYAQLGIFRRSGWTATMRGFTDKLFGAEIYPAENRYGRYQSYGAVEILQGGNLTSTGYVKSGRGWDWNLIPGATTVQLPWTSLNAIPSKTEEHQQKAFAGALSIGRDGIFGMDFVQDTTAANYASSQLHFHKSVFAFDSLIICLGSGIGASNNYGPVATTLFQYVADSGASHPGYYLDNTSPLTANTNTVLKVDSPGHWMVTGQKTSIYLPGGNDSLHIFRGAQTTPDHSDVNQTKFNTRNATKAWLGHGNSPSAARYEFVILPNMDATTMAGLAASFATRSVYRIFSQTDSFHAIRYIPAHTNAYVFFKPVTGLSFGYVKSISAPALVGVRETGDTLTINIADPDLHTVDENTDSYWHGSPATVVLTLKGSWTVLQKSDSASPVQMGDSLVTTFVLRDGLPATLKLLNAAADSTARGVWTNQYPTDSSWIYNIDRGTLNVDSLVGTGKTSISPGTGSGNGFLVAPPTGSVRVSSGGGKPRFDLQRSPRVLNIAASGTSAANKFAAFGFGHATAVASAFFTISFNDSTTTSNEWSFAIGKNGSGFFSGNSGLPTQNNSSSFPDIFGGLKWTIASGSPSIVNFQCREKAVNTNYSTQNSSFFHRGGSYNMEIYANASSRQQTYMRGITIYTVLPRTYHVWANSTQLSYNGNAGFPANEMVADSMINSFMIEGKNCRGIVAGIDSADNSARLIVGHNITVNYAWANGPIAAGRISPSNTLTPAGLANDAEVSTRLIPNPVVDDAQVIFTAVRAGKTSLVLYSMTGQALQRKELWISSGINYIPFNMKNLSPGLYTIVITGINGRQTIRLAH